MAKTSNIFEPYLGAPVTAETYKELGQKLCQYTPSELEVLFENFQPHELHLQLLKLALARTSGCHRPLLDGLKSECKYVSHFCLNTKLLFCEGNTELLDPNSLMPLLQTVSSSTRNKILWNIGKCVSAGENISVTDIDALYKVVSKVWGSNFAVPLLCQTSEELLKKELPQTVSLSNAHLLILAKRFPSLALSYLEQQVTTRASLPPPQKAARYIVRHTLPDSLNYIKKQHSSFLSKATMKIIIQNYSDNILETPSLWLDVLDKHVVKKNLKPEHFQLFLFKQLMELKNMIVPYNLNQYLELMSPLEMSALFNKVFQEKFGCAIQAKLEFWEKNIAVLKLLEASDRSVIAVELDHKNKSSNQWLPLMTTDLSIPKFRKVLSTEQNMSKRAALLTNMIDSVLLNKDQKAFEEICDLVVNRYRNDKFTIQTFFNSPLDFSSLSPEKFSLVFALAKRFYIPNDWQTRSAAKLFPIAIKRNWGEQGLKEFIENIMNNSPCFSISDLNNIENKFYLVCINEVFTATNVEDKKRLGQLASFLPLITKWTPMSTLPLITDNVKKSVLAMLKMDCWSHQAVSFVCTHLKRLNLEFIEECFLEVPHEKIFAYLFSKKSHVLTTQETIAKIGTYILKNGVHCYVSQLRKLKKLGCQEMLHPLSVLSKQAIEDSSVSNCTRAVPLLMLTSNSDDFFSMIDPLLPSTVNSGVEAFSAAGDSNKKTRYSPFSASKREDSIYYGFGLSLSHLSIASLATERLNRFCVNGDLVLFVRDGLYSVCSFLPNESAKVFLLSLMKQPVSVKKHAIRLLWRVVCNIETQEELLAQLMESEEHLSMRIILMDTAIMSFNICKYASFWKVVKEMIIKLTPDDKTIVRSLISRRVPDPFLEEYFQILLEKCKVLQNVDNVEIIFDLLSQLHHYVSLMSDKFIESIISEFFLSESFFESSHYYSAILELFIQYLKGVPASNLPLNLAHGKEERHKNLESRRQFLKERLDTYVVGGPLDVFNVVIGGYPVRRLLLMFVHSFCWDCLNNLNKPKVYPLTEYIDFLLSYFNNFNQNATFFPHIFLSLTKIITISPSESTVVIGQKFGDFTDDMLLKHSAALLCFYPQVIAKFFNSFMAHSPCFKGIHSVDVLKGMLASVTPVTGTDSTNQDLKNLLRLMTVAHILPSNWLTEDDYQDFRQAFLVLIKNTPVEVFLFGIKF